MSPLQTPMVITRDTPAIRAAAPTQDPQWLPFANRTQSGWLSKCRTVTRVEPAAAIARSLSRGVTW